MAEDADRVIEHIEAVTEAAASVSPADHRANFWHHLDHALSIADVHVREPEAGARGQAKLLAYRAMRPLAVQQSGFNRAAVEAVRQLSHMLDEAWGEIQQLRLRIDGHDRDLNRIPPATRAALAGHETTLGDLSEGQDRLRRDLDELGRRLDEGPQDLESTLQRLERSEQEVLGRVERSESDLAQQRARLQLALRAAVDAPDVGLREVADGILAMRESELYAAFEERFRGSREDVIEMLAGYEGELERLAGSGPLVDIGPGRGEWLELAKKAGVEAYGIDTNPSFVAAGEERGLDVRLGDGLTHLAGLPPSSVEAVTAFHVVEHLTTASLQDLLSAAFVALRPGGLLILETPNPTNLLVGAANFYLDPTHLRPLHPELLGFLVEAHGFGDVEIRYLHPARSEAAGEPPEGRRSDLLALLDRSIYGPQDYAVLATKPSRQESPAEPAA